MTRHEEDAEPLRSARERQAAALVDELLAMEIEAASAPRSGGSTPAHAASQGIFAGLSALLLDAILAGDRPTAVVLKQGLQRVYAELHGKRRRCLEDPTMAPECAEVAEQLGRVVGLLDVTGWSTRRLASSDSVAILESSARSLH